MKKIKYIFTFALLALLFAACSEDDIIQAPQTPSIGETEGTETVTFTATVDYSIEGDGSRTRAISATDDEPPTRFCAQALYKVNDAYTRSEVVKGEPNVDGSIKFTFEALTPNQDYTFLFWADNVNSAQLPDDLRSIPYSAGDIAFAAKVEGTPTSVEKIVDMKHVVSKVTLQHSGDNNFQPKAGDVLAVSLPCATTYNVATASGNSTQSVKHTFSNDASISEATPIFSFYNLAPASTADITLTFINDYTLTIGNASLPANAHVTLQGDLSSNNSGWIMPDEEKRAEVFYSCLFDENGNPKGISESGGTYSFYSDNRTGIYFIEYILNIERINSTRNMSIGNYSFECYLGNTAYMNSVIRITMNGYVLRIYYGTMYANDPNENFQLPSDIRTNW